MKKRFFQAVPEWLSRLIIGSVFIQSGWGKLQDLPKVISYFESLNIPFAHWQAPFVSGVELLAGLAILLGFLTRLAASPLIVIMLVAIKTAHWDNITGLSSLVDLPEFLYIGLLLWLIAYGAPSFSIDSLCMKYDRRFKGKSL